MCGKSSTTFSIPALPTLSNQILKIMMVPRLHIRQIMLRTLFTRKLCATCDARFKLIHVDRCRLLKTGVQVFLYCFLLFCHRR